MDEGTMTAKLVKLIASDDAVLGSGVPGDEFRRSVRLSTPEGVFVAAYDPSGPLSGLAPEGFLALLTPEPIAPLRPEQSPKFEGNFTEAPAGLRQDVGGNREPGDDRLEQLERDGHIGVDADHPCPRCGSTLPHTHKVETPADRPKLADPKPRPKVRRKPR